MHPGYRYLQVKYIYTVLKDTLSVAILVQKFLYPRCDKSILVKVELPQFLDEPDNDNDNFDKWEEPEDVKEASPKR
jgi:hypothetical protein